MENMRQQLSNFLNLVREDKLLHQFSDYDIYIWSNFILNESPDIDLQFVGKVTPELGEALWNLTWKYKKIFPYRLDPCMYSDTKIFQHIDKFNQSKKDIYYFDEEIIRYKCWNLKRNEYHGREVKQLDQRLYKIKQVFARKDGKYKTRNWPEAVLLKKLL